MNFRVEEIPSLEKPSPAVRNILPHISEAVRNKLAYFLVVKHMHEIQPDMTAVEPFIKIPEGAIFPIEDLINSIETREGVEKTQILKARIRAGMQTGVHGQLLHLDAGIRTVQKKALIFHGDEVLVQNNSPYIPYRPLGKHGGIKFSLKKSLEYPGMHNRIASLKTHFHFDSTTGILTIYQIYRADMRRIEKGNYTGVKWMKKQAALKGEGIPHYEKEFLDSFPNR